MSVETSFKLFGVEIATIGKRKTAAQKWNEEEHRAFLEGLKKHGKGKWTKIASEFVKTRTSTQIASHAQKYYQRISAATANKHPLTANDDVAASSSVSEPLMFQLKQTPTSAVGCGSLEPSVFRLKETPKHAAGCGILEPPMLRLKEAPAPASLNLAAAKGPAEVHNSRTRRDGVAVVDPAGAADHRLYTQGFQVCYIPVVTYPDGRRYVYRSSLTT